MLRRLPRVWFVLAAVLLALAVIRVPFIRGWLREPPSLSLAGPAAVTHGSPAVTHAEPLPMLSETPITSSPGEPVAPMAPV